MRFLLLLLTATAFADDAANEARFISNPRQLIYEGKRSGEGYFNPDGTKLIFQSEREEGNPFYQMYLLDLASGDTTRVSPGLGKTTCGFFQPGTGRVLFASTHADPESAAKQKAELEFRASGQHRHSEREEVGAVSDVAQCVEPLGRSSLRGDQPAGAAPG